MERDTFFVIVVLWICGPLILVASLWPARLCGSACGSHIERAAWLVARGEQALTVIRYGFVGMCQQRTELLELMLP